MRMMGSVLILHRRPNGPGDLDRFFGHTAHSILRKGPGLAQWCTASYEKFLSPNRDDAGLGLVAQDLCEPAKHLVPPRCA